MEERTPWLRSIRDLKLSYRGTYRALQKARDKADQEKDQATSDSITEMITDVNFAIEWMHTGRRPGSKRGIERRAAYQKNKLMDPVRMQAFAQQNTAGSPSNLTEWQRVQIKDALCRLSEREKECYVLAHGYCHSFDDIAKFLNISKSAVQKYVERAQKKISEDLQNSLFLLWD